MTGDPNAERPPHPEHIEATLQAIRRLRSRHEDATSASHRAAGAVTRLLTSPFFVSALAALVTGWIVLNLALQAGGVLRRIRLPFRG